MPNDSLIFKIVFLHWPLGFLRCLMYIQPVTKHTQFETGPLVEIITSEAEIKT